MQHISDTGNGYKVISDKKLHNFDDDGCCIKCGFDSAEWYHWKNYTYEGKASNQKQPECTK